MNISQPDETHSNSSEENLKRLSAGSVLLSQEALHDPNFESTVVLICVHNREGTYGLVLNRISHMPLGEIFDGLNGLPLSREVFIGGPVRQDELQILQLTDTPVEEAYQMAPGYYLGGRWDDFAQMIESNPETVKFFLGYSGWSANQLEGEVAAGAWDVYSVDLDQLFTHTDKLTTGPVSRIAEFLRSISHS
ncbi:hypothetical protein CHISP_3516 [Chitinispirillum alkaliphilum]|nr:hypothetical protein CHISP_3516 [Chitinispirillum alkaliphilum]